MSKNKKPFPELASSPWFTITFAIVMISILWYLSSGRTEGADPLYMYLISGLVLITLGAGSAKFKELKKLAGFKAPYPGYNLMLAILGFGIGGMVYSLITYRAQAIFQGNEYVMSLVKPFYLPLALPEQTIQLGFASAGVLIFYAYVGFFEELQKIMMFKNIVNWLSKKKVKLSIISFIAFITVNLIWASFHLFAWNGLTIGSIIFAVAFGTIFWATYFIPDSIGLLSPKKPMEWQGVLLTGSVTSHAWWDILVTVGLPLPFTQFLILSIILTVLPIFGMYFIKKVQKEEVNFIHVRWS